MLRSLLEQLRILMIRVAQDYQWATRNPLPARQSMLQPEDLYDTPNLALLFDSISLGTSGEAPPSVDPFEQETLELYFFLEGLGTEMPEQLALADPFGREVLELFSPFEELDTGMPEPALHADPFDTAMLDPQLEAWCFNM